MMEFTFATTMYAAYYFGIRKRMPLAALRR